MLSLNIYVNKRVIFAGKKTVLFSNRLNQKNIYVSRKQSFSRTIPLMNNPFSTKGVLNIL